MPHQSQKETEWGQRWPRCGVALLATLQLLLMIVIVGLESTSAAFDVNHSMSFAGLYCPIFFMITWVSMYSVTCCCCCRYRATPCCSTHAVVENVLSIIAASVLLYFNNLFLSNPFTCLFGFSSCVTTSYSSSYDDSPYSYGINNPTNYAVKLACIKAVLACAAVMLVSNVVYVLIFIVVAVKTRNLSNQNLESQYGVTSPPALVPTIAYSAYPAPQVNYQMPEGSNPILQPMPPFPLQITTYNESPLSEAKPIYPPSFMAPPMPSEPFVPPPPQPSTLSQYESSWRSKFPTRLSYVLFIVQMALTLLIVIMEIASLGVTRGFRPTGVGIWCAIPFTIASVFTFILVHKKGGSRMWATLTLIAQLVLLVFTFILIGIAGNYIQNNGYLYSSYYSALTGYSSKSPTVYNTKYQITQAQLAYGILMMFSGFFYVGMYMYVTLVALWQPHHTLDTAHLFRE